MKNKIFFIKITIITTLLFLSSLTTNTNSSTTTTTNIVNNRTLSYYDKNPSGKILLPSGKSIKVKFALNAEEQMLGLPRISPQNFADDDALLFFSNRDEMRSFWMPDTYFDLDIIFIDKNLKVLHVERNVPHYPHAIKDDGSNVSEIPITKAFMCRHVIEMSSKSKLAKEIKVGDTLNWFPPKQLEKLKKKELLASVAMSLKDVMNKIGEDFEKINPNTKVSFNFASSGQLRAQIENGAPVDIFAPASSTDMNFLFEKDLAIKNSKKDFAKNTLVLITHKSNNNDIHSIIDLQNAKIKKIAIGNPNTTPAGKYAKETFEYFKILANIKEKIIFAENVRHVLDYVSRNEVDAGIVFSTDAQVDKNVKVVFTIPDKVHQPIIYPIAIIKSSKNIELAKEFIQFVISEKGKKALKDYGFAY
ncbi:MAG: molybdate ABC transporter substrate-binding protein [Oligoflexia bacterium]|nr:molybdate ABC transporter substrate-binding protein [Oligoflexia bacterium]